MSDPESPTPSTVEPRAGEAALVALIESYAEARAAASRYHDRASTVAGHERARGEANAAGWLQTATARHAEIMSALEALTRTTLRAVPDPDLPICTWQSEIVEVRAVLPDGSRAVRVRNTPAQAVAVAAGAALIACGAVADTRTGGTLGPILPPWPTDTAPAGLRDPSATAPGEPACGAGTTNSLVEHDCHAAGTLTFRGDYGAPGVGQAWDCTACRRGWARLGDRFYPAEDGAHILTPGDCI